MRRQSGDVLSEETDAPRCRQKIAGDAIEQRCLAGAVRTEHGAALARLNREVDRIQRNQRTEVPAHGLKLEGVSRARFGDPFGMVGHWKSRPQPLPLSSSGEAKPRPGDPVRRQRSQYL